MLLRKWSVPVLAELGEERRFSELRSALPGVTPRALALCLQELEEARPRPPRRAADPPAVDVVPPLRTRPAHPGRRWST